MPTSKPENRPTAEKTTVTRWENLAGLRPKKVLCEVYPGHNGPLIACHTSLPVAPESVYVHTVEREHGGTFHITLEAGESDFWTGIKSLGLELLDLRCAVCREKVRPTAAAVLHHIRPHNNPDRVMEEGGTFFITVSTVPAPDSGEE